MLLKEFDIQKYLRSLKEFDAIESSSENTSNFYLSYSLENKSSYIELSVIVDVINVNTQTEVYWSFFENQLSISDIFNGKLSGSTQIKKDERFLYSLKIKKEYFESDKTIIFRIFSDQGQENIISYINIPIYISFLNKKVSLLDPSKKFRNSLSNNFSIILSEISNSSREMEISVSDSKRDEDFLIEEDKRFSPSTWFARGDKINETIQDCLNTLSELSNSESSSISNYSFSSDILDIIYSQLFGKNLINDRFTYTDEIGNSLFGNFNKIFGFNEELYTWEFSENGYDWIPIRESDNSIYSKKSFEYTSNYSNLDIRVKIKYSNLGELKILEFKKESISVGDILKTPEFLSGLNVLNKFNSLKSYNRNIFNTYKNGITFSPPDLFSQPSNYSESFKEDSNFIAEFCGSLESDLKKIAIIVDNIYKNCDNFGRYAGYEGLGNIKGQFLNLKKLFPRSDNNKGIINFIESFKKIITSEILSITSFSSSGSSEILADIKFKLIKLSENLETFCSLIARIGIKDKEEITDKSNIYGSSTRDEIISQLKLLNFNNQQINTILSSKDLSCSFVFLYDSMDEKDIYSYFRGGRLAEYIYYMGGEAAIRETLEFLISKKEPKYFINILKILEKNKDYSLAKNKYIYGNILGTFISIFPEFLLLLNEKDYSSDESASEYISSLITSDTFSFNSNSLLSRVSSRISSPFDIDFDQVQDGGLILKTFVKLLQKGIKDLKKEYRNSRFLNSINGLSAKELNIILGGIEGTKNYELSGLLSGIEGGRYQALISGLIHATLLPKTSPVLLPANRRSFILGETRINSSIEELINLIYNFSKKLKDLSSLLSDFSIKDEESIKTNIISPIIYSINKDFSFLINALNGKQNQQFLIDIQNAKDSERPGIGNSPEIDSSQKRGVLVPEQSREIENLLGLTPQDLKILDEVDISEKYLSQRDLLSKWIKLNFSELDILPAIKYIERSIPQYSIDISDNFSYIKEKISEFINEGFINSEKSNLLIETINTTGNKSIVNNPISICSKLGKTESICQKEYTSKNKISSEFGKTLKPTSIPIDRPLGSLAKEYNSYSKTPGAKLLETLSNGKISAISIDIPSTESYIKSIDVLPSIIFPKNINTDNIFNIEERKLLSGLFDLSNNHLYIEKYSYNSKPSTNDCRNLLDPIERKLCFNYIKCTKFKPSIDQRYLAYCPESTIGGSLK